MAALVSKVPHNYYSSNSAQTISEFFAAKWCFLNSVLNHVSLHRISFDRLPQTVTSCSYDCLEGIFQLNKATQRSKDSSERWENFWTAKFVRASADRLALWQRSWCGVLKGWLFQWLKTNKSLSVGDSNVRRYAGEREHEDRFLTLMSTQHEAITCNHTWSIM